MNNETQVNSGSNASDFQPPTGDPQNDVNGNLQPVAEDLQPNTTESGALQQNLSSPGQLKVINSSEGSTSTIPAPTQTQNTQGLNLGLPIVLVILLIIFIFSVWLLAKFFRPSNKKVPEEVQPTQMDKPKQSTDKSRPKRKPRKSRRR